MFATSYILYGGYHRGVMYASNFYHLAAPAEMPVGRRTSSLSRELDKFEEPYGIKRSRASRTKARLGLSNGGTEHSYRKLYQQRMKDIISTCPYSFEDTAQDPTKWLQLKSFAAGCPFTEPEEHHIRHIIEDYCFQLWAVDEMVRYQEIWGSSCFYTNVAGVQCSDRSKRCELWDEDNDYARSLRNPKTTYEHTQVIAVRALEARFKESLKSFQGLAFDKPLRYLALCVLEETDWHPEDCSAAGRWRTDKMERLVASICRHDAKIHKDASRKRQQLRLELDVEKETARLRKLQLQANEASRQPRGRHSYFQFGS